MARSVTRIPCHCHLHCFGISSTSCCTPLCYTHILYPSVCHFYLILCVWHALYSLLYSYSMYRMPHICCCTRMACLAFTVVLVCITLLSRTLCMACLVFPVVLVVHVSHALYLLSYLSALHFCFVLHVCHASYSLWYLSHQSAKDCSLVTCGIFSITTHPGLKLEQKVDKVGDSV